MKRVFWVCIIVGLMSFLGIHSAAALSLGFDPSTQSVASGQTTTVNVEVSGLTGSGPYIGALDLFVDFDPTNLIFNSFTFGPYLGVPGWPTVSGATAFTVGPTFQNLGEFEIQESAILSDPTALQSGLPQFSLGTITFATTGTGIDGLAVSFNASIGMGLYDETGMNLLTVNSFVPGSITITSAGPGPGPGPAVPEPSTICLLVMGLAGLMARPVLKRSKGS